MTPGEIRALLQGVREGSVPPAHAEARLLDQLRGQPFEDLGYAKVDHHRAVRQGGRDGEGRLSVHDVRRNGLAVA